MRNIIRLIFILFFSFQLSAQDTIQKHVVKKYVPLKAYKELFGETTDTTEFMYSNNDTLVSVPLDFDPFEGQKVKKVLYEPKDADFLETYMNVAYGTGTKVDSTRHMKYWKDDIRIYFDESVPEADVRFMMKIAENISNEVDSLNISRNFIKEKSNYFVYYLNKDFNVEHEPRIGSKSGYYIHWNGKNQIYKGTLKINTTVVKNNLLKENLLLYHFFKSLGYFSKSEKLNCESILSTCNSYRSLTQDDLELLKYHYSYGVCKGTDLKSFNDLTTSMNDKLEKNPNAKLYVVHHE